MKNLCCFLRQNIVQKPSIASIREGTHTYKIVHVDRQMHKVFIVFVYILNLGSFCDVIANNKQLSSK